MTKHKPTRPAVMNRLLALNCIFGLSIEGCAREKLKDVVVVVYVEEEEEVQGGTRMMRVGNSEQCTKVLQSVIQRMGECFALHTFLPLSMPLPFDFSMTKVMSQSATKELQ